MTKRYFTIEALPAKKGDSLIIYEGPSDGFKVAVIDGGPSGVYEDFLRPRLSDIRVEKNLDENTPLFIDFMMISHLDDDHINGILGMSKELEAQKKDHEAPFLEIGNLWNNTFDSILGNDQGALETIPNGGNPTASVDTVNWSTANLDHDSEAVLASIGQGYKLRRYSTLLDWRINAPFNNDALIMQRGTDEDIVKPFSDNVKFTIVGPLKPEIDKLQEEYDKYLRDRGLERNDKEAVLSAMSQDRSTTNLSSLVVLLEHGDKSILLTGDALGSKIIKGLEMQGLMQSGGALHVNVLKMQHHGSFRNVTPEFFKQVTADHYIFCGNGEHGNPERKTIEWLMAARGSDEYTLHFTYPIHIVDRKREEEIHGGRVWNNAHDSLQALFDTAADNVTVNVPDNKTGVRIDLIDPIKF